MKKIRIITTTVLFILLSNSSFAYIFSDIHNSNYYLNSTQYLYVKNIIKGYTDGKFRTEQKINRAETLKILLEGNNINLLDPDEDCFPDISIKDWFSPYVCTAKKLGIIDGYPDKTFKPEQTVTKVEALKMIGELYGWDIRDDESELWYLPYTLYAENKNIIPEIEIHKENNSELSRGSIAEMIYRILAINELEVDLFTHQAELEIQAKIEEKKSKINPNNIQIILRWENPEIDLDAYLITPNNEEVNYRRKLSTDHKILFESKDNEEIINIENLKDGNYEFFVINERNFKSTEATVEIYENKKLTQSFKSKSSKDNIWKVFNILDGSDLLILNEFGDCNLIQKINSYCN